MTSLKKIGEFGLIKKIQKEFFPKTSAPWKLGIGDDAAWAQIPAATHLLATKDLLIEEVHFVLGSVRDFEDLGWKSLAVNLSDIAAMAAKPLGALIGLAVPPETSLAQIRAFYRGLRDCSETFQCPIVGGDTNRSDRWLISITVLGSSPLTPILRSGAQVGDTLWVTGELGAAALGWNAVQKKDRSQASLFFRRRHARPEPRLAWALAMFRTGCLSSMIDLSDGLSGDVQHLAEASKVGFEIELDHLPRAPQFEKVCQKLDSPEFEMLLNGGEDYELLFTVGKHCEKKFQDLMKRRGIPLTKIGKAIRSTGIVYRQDGKIVKLPKSWGGFRHF